VPEHPERGEHERDVEQEQVPPRRGIDQPSPGIGAQRHADGRQAGPDADAASPVACPQRAVEQGQAAGHHQRRTDPLEESSGDQGADRRCDRAQHRRDEHDDQPGGQHAAAAEVVDHGSRGEQQGRGGEQVSRHHPLHPGHAGPEAAADGRHGHVDDGCVQEGDHRGEDRGGDERTARAAPQRHGRVLDVAPAAGH
jgi:hypothetical protein